MTVSLLFPLAQKDAFLIPSGAGLHIFFLMTDPGKHDEVLLLNASTVYPDVVHDSSCYLGPAEHPFFQHQSYIIYARARRILKQRLRSLVASGEVIHRPPPLTAAGFAAVAAGTTSIQLAPEMKIFFDAYR